MAAPPSKRSRQVTFTEAGDDHEAKRGAGAGSSRPARSAAIDEFDDEDEGDTKYAEIAADGGSDDESGNELEEAAGGDGVDRKSSEFDAKSKASRKAEDSDDDEDAAGTRGKKITRVKGEVAGLEEEFDEAGVAFEPFNLRSERAEGHFDASGEYVRKKRDPEEEPDAWLDELDAMHPKQRRALQDQARRFHKGEGAAAGAGAAASAGAGAGASSKPDADDEDEAGGNDEEDEEESPEVEETGQAAAMSKARFLETAVRLLRDGETVAAGLRRLGGAGAATRQGKAAASHSHAGAGASSSGPSTGRDMAVFTSLTEAADGLVNREGLAEVYSMDRRALKMELADALADAGLSEEQQASILRGASAAQPVQQAEAGASAAGSVPAPSQGQVPQLPAGKQWEYQWPQGATAGDSTGGPAGTFGPYDSSAMNAWIAAGYFSAHQPVVREVGSQAFVPLLQATQAGQG